MNQEPASRLDKPELAENFYVKGGTLRHDARCYVERAADRQLFEAALRGEFSYVLTSRQMGKSSLMVRTAWRLRQAGLSVAVIDLTSIGQNLPPDQWYDGMLGRLGHALDCEDGLEDFWRSRSHLGPLQRWLETIQEIILKPFLTRLRRNEEAPAGSAGNQLGTGARNHAHAWSGVVIFIDEVDVVRSLPFSTDEFFAGIRECYNRRTVEPEFNVLTFCLLGVASPSDLMRNSRMTPFNIGRRIELTDFNEDEAGQLAHGLGRDETTARMLLKRIFYWTNGHPYLTQVLCQAAAADDKVNGPAGVDRLCESLFLSQSARDRDDNLLFVREWLLKSQSDRASLLGLYGAVLQGERVPFDRANELVEVLRLSGVVRVVDDYLAVRNRIYYRVFDDDWLLTHRPGARETEERQAYRRGFRRGLAAACWTFGLTGTVVLAAFGLARLWTRYAPRNAAIAHETRVQPLWLSRTIPKRSEQASTNQLDLSRHYNGLLGGPWHGLGENNHLGSLSPGLLVYSGSRFDARGVVQLAGEKEELIDLPPSLGTVRIAQRIKKLHLLHACWRRGADGQAVASVILRYENGYKVEFPITYGEHVSYWWANQGNKGETNRLAEAWTGLNPVAQAAGARLRLFQATWTNPFPAHVVSSLDVTSEFTGPALLLVAVTME